MTLDAQAQPVGLSRRLGFVLLTLYGLGVTVGAGIYVLVGEVAGRSGMFAPLSFIVAAIVILPTAYSFSILVTRYPYSSGEARYVEEAFSQQFLTTGVGLLVATVGIVSAATVTVGSAGYIRALWDIPREVIVLVVTVSFGLLALRGIKESVAAAAFLTIIEVGGLLAIIGFGLTHDLTGFANVVGHQVSEFEPSVLMMVLPGAILAFYAFVGFEDMVNVAEEVKSPSTVFPLSIFVVLAVTSVIYFFIAALAVNLVPLEVLDDSESPLTDVAIAAGIANANVITIIGAVAALNGILIQLIMASRVLYGLARMKQIPSWFGKVHPGRRTPTNAILIVTIIVLALAITSPIERLASWTSQITLLVFTLVNAALIKLAFDGKVVINQNLMQIPFFGMLLSMALLISEYL